MESIVTHQIIFDVGWDFAHSLFHHGGGKYAGLREDERNFMFDRGGVLVPVVWRFIGLYFFSCKNKVFIQLLLFIFKTKQAKQDCSTLNIFTVNMMLDASKRLTKLSFCFVFIFVLKILCTQY